MKVGDRVYILVDWPDFGRKTLNETGTIERVYETGYCLVRLDEKFSATFLNSEIELVP